MPKKKLIASLLTSVLFFSFAGSVAATWYSGKIRLPAYRPAYTVARDATSGTQSTKVTYAGGNHTVYSNIVKFSGGKYLSSWKKHTFGVTYSHKTGVKKGTAIQGAFKTAQTYYRRNRSENSLEALI